ncbi:MAG: RnfABCDGE type electron transport complex subunit D [Deltaproteobacteria bacterium]|nr:RnfABCDGE type electron transport complex subunit D [Deltaproteobacteria bacterium]MBW1993031.1 RnfABCDGE type electron transport complex subunit D [Deltaproteobacteria bacterium]MBW2151896.1 RnfABCDGE type electron transport complex subunit D [Deltaproteobacteria bacterium]
MVETKKFIVSHAPFWHSGKNVTQRSYHMMIAALPAVIAGFVYYGMPAVAVICLSVASAMIWEYAFNRVAKGPVTIGDGNAALIGLLLGMLLPATAPWWLVIIGTFIAIVVGKQIYGGIGTNPFHPALVAMAMLILSWKDYLDFDQAYLHYDFGFVAVYPLGALKHFGTSAIEPFGAIDLLLGRQIGGIGAVFGFGLIAGGVYLIYKGFIRWEISISFLAGIFVTSLIFYIADSNRFAGPLFHLFSGYTLLGAFFLATEDSSSPVHFVPMLIYGAAGGLLTVLIRSIGKFPDGVVFAILIINLINPLVDKIRPKAIGKVI